MHRVRFLFLLAAGAALALPYLAQADPPPAAPPAPPSSAAPAPAPARVELPSSLRVEQDNFSFFPADTVAAALGAAVEIKKPLIMFRREDDCLVLSLGSSATMSTKAYHSPSTPREIADKVYVPLRPIAEFFGAALEWNPSTHVVSVLPAPPPPPPAPAPSAPSPPPPAPAPAAPGPAA